MPLNRRQFVKATGATALATQTAPLFAKSVSRNEKLRIGVIGFNGRGGKLINAIKSSNDAELVALCDVDSEVLKNKEKGNSELFRTGDYRELLDRKDIDAIASATPNHWHTLIAMAGVMAGKHVYIEKPISHNMMESRHVVLAADKTGKLIQCGFQNRSDTGLVDFFEGLNGGSYGKVLSVHGTCYRARTSIGKRKSPLKTPSNVNYDMWLGPARERPIMRPKLHYDWHWDFNTGNGDVGNQGPHEWDLINWALGDPENLPSKMLSAGNRFGWNDAGNTPNVMACAGQVGDVPIFFEVMDLKPGRRPPKGNGVGVIIETEQGRFVGGRGGGSFVSNDGKIEKFARSKKEDGTNDHMQNFVDCVLSDSRDKLKSDCSVAARSSAMAHMANISFQMGRTANAEQLETAYGGSVTERDMLARLRESTMIYAMQNRVDKMEPWVLGQSLSFDNEKYVFTGDRSELANKRMIRDYRAGYELPKV